MYALSVRLRPAARRRARRRRAVARAAGSSGTGGLDRPARVRRLGADRRHRRAQGPGRRRDRRRAFPSPTSRPGTRSSSRSRSPWPRCWGRDDIFIGVNAVDYSGYPDCRPEFIAAFEQMANLATKARRRGAPAAGSTRRSSTSPRPRSSAAGRAGRRLRPDPVVLRPSPAGEACGHCDSCLLRLKGFADARLVDPAPYRGSQGTASSASPIPRLPSRRAL